MKIEELDKDREDVTLAPPPPSYPEAKGESRARRPVVEISYDTLPSKGIGYPAGSTIAYKSFTYGDLVNFNSSKLSAISRYEYIMSGISTSGGLNPGDIYYNDFIFIAVLRKISAFSSSTLTVAYKCSECQTDNHQDHQISTLNFSDLEVPSLPVIISDNDTEYEITPLTYSKYMSIIGDDDFELKSTALMISNLTFQDAYDLVKNADGDLLLDLEEAIDAINFSKQYLDVKCTSCGSADIIKVSEVPDLIMPFRRSRSSAKSRLRFGKV